MPYIHMPYLTCIGTYAMPRRVGRITKHGASQACYRAGRVHLEAGRFEAYMMSGGDASYMVKQTERPVMSTCMMSLLPSLRLFMVTDNHLQSAFLR